MGRLKLPHAYLQNKFMENEEKDLESSEEWKHFTEIQKKIILKHLSDPELTKYGIAKELGVDGKSVRALFSSPHFEKLNQEIARAEKRELIQLSIKALRECLLSKSEMVKLSAALKILQDAELLTDKKLNKGNENILVVWGKEDKNGSKDKLYSLSEAVGNTPEFPKIQSSSSRA